MKVLVFNIKEWRNDNGPTGAMVKSTKGQWIYSHTVVKHNKHRRLLAGFFGIGAAIRIGREIHCFSWFFSVFLGFSCFILVFLDFSWFFLAFFLLFLVVSWFFLGFLSFS